MNRSNLTARCGGLIRITTALRTKGGISLQDPGGPFGSYGYNEVGTSKVNESTLGLGTRSFSALSFAVREAAVAAPSDMLCIADAQSAPYKIYLGGTEYAIGSSGFDTLRCQYSAEACAYSTRHEVQRDVLRCARRSRLTSDTV